MALILLTAAYAALLATHLWKYPYFPGSPSHDYLFHLSQSRDAATGSLNPLQTPYPPAVHYLIALGAVVLPPPATQSMMVTMITLSSLSPLLLYAAAAQLDGRRLGLVAALLYIVASPLWRLSLFTGGFYANHLADLLSLAVLYLLIRYARRGGRSLLPALLVTGLVLAASHFTAAVFLLSLWAFTPVLASTRRDELGRYVKGASTVSLPALVALALRPDLIASLLTIPARTPGIIIADPNQTSPLLAVVSPFLAFLSDFTSPLFLLLLGTGYAVAIATRRPLRKNLWVFFPAVWLALPWLLAPASELASRFSVYALLPLVLMAPLAVHGVATAIAQVARRENKSRTLFGLAALGLSVIITLAMSPNIPIVQHLDDISSSASDVRRLQESILDTMNWVRSNTAPNSTFASIGRWEMTYLPLLGQRTYIGDYALTPETMVPEAERLHADHIIVWKGLTDLSQQYRSSTLLSRLESNQAFEIYRVK